MATLADLISSDKTLSIFSEALKVTELAKELDKKSDFSVFAPTDDAFTRELHGMGIKKEDLFADKEKLKAIVSCHIVNGMKIFSRQVREDMFAPSENGIQLELSSENDMFYVNGINVIQPDRVVDNGVLHIINRIIMPGKA